METKISVTDEKHLTRAIEKAATIATVNDSLDRNELLANQLKAEGVDCRFAKVASAAFNKRITVLTFQKTADEHRSEPFALTDDAKVYSLMGGKTQEKTASVASPTFKIQTYTAGRMQKTASVPVSKPRYEHTVDCDTYKLHVESMIEKQAAEFSKITGMYESLQSKVKEDAETLANYFQKSACSSFEFTTAVNCFGDSFKDAISDYLPHGTDFTKTASAVMPDTYIFQKIATLIKESQAVKDLEAFISYYGRGLAEFSKTAGMLGDFLAKADYLGITKQAGGIPPTLAIMGRSAIIQALNAKDQAHDLVDSTSKAFATGLGNAINMYNAGNIIGMAPNDVLDAEFLIKDRFRDRLMGWSDMSADPQFAMYPAEQVFAATQKAMDTDSSLERPDRREVLRTTVGQLLAQNNRFSTADVAALSTTLKNLTGTGGNPANIAATGVSSEKVTGTEKPELNSITDALPPYKRLDFKGQMAELQKDVEAYAKQKADAAAAAQAAEETKARAKAQEESDAKAKAEQEEKDKKHKEERAADAAERRQAASDYQEFQARERQKDRDATEAAAARSDKTYRQALAIQAMIARKGQGTFTLPTPPTPPTVDTATSDSTKAPGGTQKDKPKDKPKEKETHDFDRNIPKPPQHVNAWTTKDQALNWASRLGFAERSKDTSYMDTEYNQGAYDRGIALGATPAEMQAAYNRGVAEADRKASKGGK
jgi:predicted NBD/HSP70 family sugar kinase